MATIRTEGLLLRAVDVGESDRIVHLLTPATGRIAVVAKGARRSVKRFPGTLDFFNHLSVQIERRRSTGLARLEHGALLSTFGALRTSPARFGLGCYLLELLDRLAPEGGAPDDTARLFRFSLGALRLVETSPPDRRLRTLLELRALEALGMRPELRRCVRCGKELVPPVVPAGFHVPDGGPVCVPCARPSDGLLAVHLGTLRALQQSLNLDLDRLGRLSLSRGGLEQARLLVERFQRFHLGLELRSERFLDQILAAPAAPTAAAAPLD